MKRTGNPNQGATVRTAAPAAFNFGNLTSSSDDGGLPEPAAKYDTLPDSSVRPYVADLPNFKQINRIPIVEVAEKTGWEVVVEEVSKKPVQKVVCPRSSEHQPGTSPYLKVLLSNNKVVCESCDTYPMSVLDMVQELGGFDTVREAAEYVASHYPDLPRKPKATYLKNPAGERVPPGSRDPWTLLITSGIYAELSVPSQRLLPILLDFAKRNDDGAEHALRLAYRAMMRYSGIGTFTGISEALTELKAIGLLERLPARRREHSPERKTAEYVLTPLSQRLKKFADATAAKLGAAIFQEKAIRRQERLERDRKRMFPNPGIHKM